MIKRCVNAKVEEATFISRGRLMESTLPKLEISNAWMIKLSCFYTKNKKATNFIALKFRFSLYLHHIILV